jgi:acetyl/propionyl-CoA carboxylase alpha subunit/acetyl-CoA carboxylase carboxyltransferase component
LFQRIAIVNRGEAAMRLIHAVRDLNAQGHQYTTIALFTDVEKQAMFVREADEAYSLGPASARPYLNYSLLERTLVQAKAEAVWVGWGFVAEHPEFVELCARNNITFIGPSADAMRKLGDKIGSKLIAEEVGVPVAPWSKGGVDTLEEALAAAEQIGYPLMLKATAGGGGRGIRRVDAADDLTDAYQRTREEAERAFGSGVVFLEQLVQGARHVEVQIIADGQGTAWAVGVRDCSVQRRNQKIIEESASPLLDHAQVQGLKDAAERLAIAVGYCGAGTVEFLYHPENNLFAFLEVNTRLQVEHPITEATTGLDLVKLQIHVAQGGQLTGERPAEIGHAVEARLNAEDPDRDFAPAPGRIELLELPAGPGIRVDTGVGEGDVIPADFDSMIAKVIAWGADREEALARLRRAMSETSVVISGGATNKSFVLDLLGQPEVTTGGATGWADTGWIDRVRQAGGLISTDHSAIALVVAGIEAYEDQEQLEIARLLETARGGRPQVQHKVGRAVDLKLRGLGYQVAVVQVGPSRYVVQLRSGENFVDVAASLERLDEFHSRVAVNGQRFRVVNATHGPVHLVEVNGVAHRVSRDEGGVLRSPAPALVVATPVRVGDEVASGAPILVLESMKMETVLHAPFAGRVKELMVMTGSQVETGAQLLRIEPIADAVKQDQSQDNRTGSRDSLELPSELKLGASLQLAESLKGDLLAVVMGYDVDPNNENAALLTYLEHRSGLVQVGIAVKELEAEVLTIFADFAELSRNRPFGEELRTELRVHSSREHFHTYLQSLDVERGGLPEQFSARLSTVLRHYGVETLDRTPALEEAVFRVFLAQQRSAPEVGIATAILEQWLGESPPDTADAARWRGLLERVVRAMQLRFPIIADLARSVRFRWFDQPGVDAERADILNGVRAELEALSANPDSPGWTARIRNLAAIPEQLVGFLAARMSGQLPPVEPMLEVLIQRHYLEFDLRNLRSFSNAGRPFTTADYTLEDRPTRIVSALGTLSELHQDQGELSQAITAQLAERPPGYEAVVELYLKVDQEPPSGEQLAEHLATLSWTQQVRRVSVAICDGHQLTVDYATARPTAVGWGEDRRVRGMHPMVGRRLNLWRLRDFNVTRLEAPEDVLLYECVAKSNPDDRRLVAMAQVRQLAVVRDESGAVIGLPHAERAVENCLEAIRRVRTSRGAAASRLDMNHVWVQVWPVVEADLQQLAALQAKITPLSEGVGLEEVLAQGRVADPDGVVRPIAIRFRAQPGAGVRATIEEPPTEPLKPLDEYDAKVLRARRRGLVYPYELEEMLTGDQGSLVELDLDDAGKLLPVDRVRGGNRAGLMVAKVITPTALYPEGITRVVLCGDPTKSLGSVAEPECARIIAALDLAQELRVPVEWFALSSGARISMDSGTENMDWVAKALKRIVEFTQAGGEINVVVAGINVGAQPYWNAEATMLMHTKGILIMTPDSAMVLTGKQSLDFSGGVSAEDNFGIGGYDRVMGPNGQAQYWAQNLGAALEVLLAHYNHTYVAPGETRPRRASTADPHDRDVTLAPHVSAESDFVTVGDIFSVEKNPDRKKAFDIRAVMQAVTDTDHPTTERWAGMADAETAVVFDARVGGHSVCLLGIESRPVPRRGFPPTDGPDVYTAGTLFPRSSKKVARAINAASGNRPLVVLANLSGFDGSPDSMRNLQLEYGAEIGRAVVNFDGPIVFCVVSRYHGGAFVVFSKALNPRMTVLAVEGSFASVIGGAPAAAVVFAGEVEKRVAADSRVLALQREVQAAEPSIRAALGVEYSELRASVRAEKIAEMAIEFDGVHDINRAVKVGSVDEVIPARRIRPRIIEALDVNRAAPPGG